MDRGAWWATVQRVAKSRARLSMSTDSPYKKETQTSRTPREDEGKDLGDALTTLVYRRWPTACPKLGERHGTDFPSEPLEEVNPANICSDFQPLGL